MFSPPDWYALEARSLALSSEPVVTATQRSSTAEIDCQAALRSWRALQATSATADQISRAATAVATARHEADADDALVEAIRANLIGHGPQLSDWQPGASAGPAQATLPSASTPDPPVTPTPVNQL